MNEEILTNAVVRWIEQAKAERERADQIEAAWDSERLARLRAEENLAVAMRALDKAVA